MSGNLGTGFAQSGFSNEPNVSPFNQWFSNAVLAVLTRLSVYPPGTGGGGGSGITSLGGTDASTSAIYGFTNTPVCINGATTSVGVCVVNTIATATVQGLGGINFITAANHSIGVTGKFTTVSYLLNP